MTVHFPFSGHLIKRVLLPTVNKIDSFLHFIKTHVECNDVKLSKIRNESIWCFKGCLNNAFYYKILIVRYWQIYNFSHFIQTHIHITTVSKDNGANFCVAHQTNVFKIRSCVEVSHLQFLLFLEIIVLLSCNWPSIRFSCDLLHFKYENWKIQYFSWKISISNILNFPAHFTTNPVILAPTKAACASSSDSRRVSPPFRDLDDDNDAFSRPLPELFPVGDRVVADLAPDSFGRTSLVVQRPSNVQFNWTVSAQAKLVVYGRQTLPPTPTQHDFAKILLGQKLHALPVEIAKPYSDGQVNIYLI